jgi:cytosine/adenosine deaminase-related metal-dependent hydrolase
MAVFNTGEAMHRDREVRIEPFLWTTPISNSVLIMSKFLSTLLLLFALILSVGVAAVVIQIIRQHTPIDLVAYLKVYCLILLPSAFILTAISVLGNVVLRNKYAFYVVSIGTASALFYLVSNGYNHWLYNPVMYRLWNFGDLIGSASLGSILWRRVVWLAIAIVCLAIAHLFFPRKTNWRRVMMTLVALTVSLTFGGRVAAQSSSSALALTHITVIDMTGAPPHRDMTVVVTGNRITDMGTRNHVRIPRNARIINAAGKFLIPGLWDMHVHFTRVDTTFPLFIANGVTGVRNMGGDLDDLLRWRADVRAGKRLGPQIVTCGPIVDGPEPAAQGPTIVVKNEAEARAAVDSLKQRAADCVKVYDKLPRDAYFAIIDEARKQSLPVVGHTPLSITTLEASDAGQKSIEHLGSILEGSSSLGAALFDPEKSLPPVKDPSEFPRRLAARGRRMLDTYDSKRAANIFAHFVKNQTWQVPTLDTKYVLTFIDSLFAKADDRLKYVPAADQRWWSPTKNFFARYRTPEYISYRYRLWQKELDLVRDMHRAGVPFMTGTDLGGAYTFPGFSVHHELELFVQAGFTPMEALQTATRNPAIFLGQSDSSGTVERGKVANLVLLDANPLNDVRNTQRINAVVLNGRLLSRAELDKLLRNAALAARN